MRIRDRSTVYLYSISVCMGSFVLGYELTSYGHLFQLLTEANQFEDQQQYVNITTLLNSLLALTAIFGVSFYRCAINSFGYLGTFRIIDYLTIIGSLIGAFSLSISSQVLSRLLLGLAVGLNTIVIPVYLTSCLPGSMGGPAGTLNQLFITIGIFFGYLFGLSALDSTVHELAWRLITALPIIPSLVRLYTTNNVFPYETVEMMIETNNDFLLHRYVDHIWDGVSLQQFKQSKKLDQEDIIAQQALGCDEVGQSFRRRFTVVCFIIFFNQFSGSSTSFALAKYVFPQVVGAEAGDVTWSFAKLTFLQVIITYLAGQFLERYGRRAFMLEGMRIILVCNILLGLIELAAPQLKSIEYLIIFIHIVGFSLSYGPCSFLVATEIMHDITYPSIIFWIFIFSFGLINDVLLVFYGASFMFFFFAAITLFGIIYLAASLVQTQGKSRQKVYQQFREMCFPLPMKWRKFLTNRGTAIRTEVNLSMVTQRGSQ